MEPTSQTGFLAWWKRTPLYRRILGALVLGVIVGMIVDAWAGSPALWGDILGIPSRLVLRLLGALAPVIILLAIIQSLMKAQFEKGTMGRLVRLLLLNTLAAIFIGLFVANVVRPGQWTKLDLAAAKAHGNEAKPDAPKKGMLQQFLDNVPKSLLGPLTDDGRVMAVIFIAVGFGIALRKAEQSPSLKNLSDLIDLGFKTLITILHWIIELVPLAVFGLVASIIGTQGFGAFHALGVFVLAVILALLLQAVYYLTRVRLGSWVRPLALLRGTRDAMIMAFSTSSSTVTMPLTFECLWKRVGLREKSAKIGALVGSNFNNDGTALYEAMAALFISQLLGIELTLMQQFLVVVTSVVASVGAAGIPEAGLVTMTLVFQAVDLPPVLIALLLPVDWFLDRCRTVINVMGDMNVACLFDGKTREAPGASLNLAPSQA
jgi:DAACS family dicarboxylate/amino acid:cation (Na+ or H+) symporter